MDRFAVFVDARYFFSAGAKRAIGETVKRESIILKDPKAMLEYLVKHGRSVCDAEHLLRVYWYDARPNGNITPEQFQLAELSSLKLRIGVLNSCGKQKGVDVLLVTDLSELSRNGAITDAVLVSGDKDTLLGVQLAQSHGIRVHLMTVGDPQKEVSRSLIFEADTVHQLPAEDFANFFARRSGRNGLQDFTPAPNPCETVVESIDDIISQIETDLDHVALLKLQEDLRSKYQIPYEFDAPLLRLVCQSMQRFELTDDERCDARDYFREKVLALNSITNPDRIATEFD